MAPFVRKIPSRGWEETSSCSSWPTLDDRESALAVAERFVAALEPCFVPGGIELFVRGSMGLSIYPDDAREPAELVRMADSAMYLAKASGERVTSYRGDVPAAECAQLEIESSLQIALASEQFELFYQPQVCVADGSHCAAEALLRWRHPRLGVLTPERFMPIAEETGLGVALGNWVLVEACRFARRWLDSGGVRHDLGERLAAAIRRCRFREQRCGGFGSLGLSRRTSLARSDGIAPHAFAR